MGSATGKTRIFKVLTMYAVRVISASVIGSFEIGGSQQTPLLVRSDSINTCPNKNGTHAPRDGSGTMGGRPPAPLPSPISEQLLHANWKLRVVPALPTM